MNSITEVATPPISFEELARRTAEYKRMGFEKQAMPHIVYHGLWIVCPWPGCGFGIGAIDFQLETGDPGQYASYLKAWWQGAGLVGRCPHCHQNVLFAFDDKKCVSDPAPAGSAVLPDDWYERAHTFRD